MKTFDIDFSDDGLSKLSRSVGARMKAQLVEKLAAAGLADRVKVTFSENGHGAPVDRYRLSVDGHSGRLRLPEPWLSFVSLSLMKAPTQYNLLYIVGAIFGYLGLFHSSVGLPDWVEFPCGLVFVVCIWMVVWLQRRAKKRGDPSFVPATPAQNRAERHSVRSPRAQTFDLPLRRHYACDTNRKTSRQ